MPTYDCQRNIRVCPAKYMLVTQVYSLASVLAALMDKSDENTISNLSDQYRGTMHEFEVEQAVTKRQPLFDDAMHLASFHSEVVHRWRKAQKVYERENRPKPETDSEKREVISNIRHCPNSTTGTHLYTTYKSPLACTVCDCFTSSIRGCLFCEYRLCTHCLELHREKQ